MDRFAIFVDAGYFFAAGAYAITSSHVPRRNISLTSDEMRKIRGLFVTALRGRTANQGKL
jgi:hypothetical protein